MKNADKAVKATLLTSYMIPKPTWLSGGHLVISQGSSAPKKSPRQPRLRDPLQSSSQRLRPASRGGNHLDAILPGAKNGDFHSQGVPKMDGS